MFHLKNSKNLTERNLALLIAYFAISKRPLDIMGVAIMEINAEKPVKFEYCNTCVHKEKLETDDPCEDCLSTFTNTWSHKPIYYEEEKK